MVGGFINGPSSTSRKRKLLLGGRARKALEKERTHPNKPQKDSTCATNGTGARQLQKRDQETSDKG